MKIAFLWYEVSRMGEWGDGLWAALQHLKKDHDVRYFEPMDYEGIQSFNPDCLLYWGSFIENTRAQVVEYPWKKAILFAGGPIESRLVDGWDMYFVESEINERELEALGKPYIRAFGINEEIFKPLKHKKKYEAIFAGAFARWKRHYLFAESIENGLVIGKKQEWEKECYEVCEENGITVLEQATRQEVAKLINQSEVVLNPADFWGGGQRLTLEAMACNVPPIIMSDSPKNREYVEEAGFGAVADPNKTSIREAIEKVKKQKPIGRDYIMSKWTAKHYANALNQWLTSL